jgi:hypothetical protein
MKRDRLGCRHRRLKGKRGELLVAAVTELFLDSAVLINVGDFLARWTRNAVQSTQHRVVPTTHATADRYSLAFFCQPNWHAPVDLGRRDSELVGDVLPMY